MKNIIEYDPLLSPFTAVLSKRRYNIEKKEAVFTKNETSLSNVCNSHLFYGLHLTAEEWVFREWAPNATAIYWICEKNDWRKHPDYALKKTENGSWEIKFPIRKLKHKELYKLLIEWQGGYGERIPSHAKRVVQDEYTKVFSAQIWNPKQPYKFKEKTPVIKNPIIYEAHIGMSTEYPRVATFKEFQLFVLPRISKLGYNTIQLMAIQEHPYYGSFGYQVANFFAVSSRFGTPEELKELIDTAHGLGIAVIMDLVHSHSVSNELEGLGNFDGKEDLYFYQGDKGYHPQWKSRCFDYGKDAVIHFLLSNCKFWLEEYQFDGFRFDGVTSMLYFDHGLERDFTEYRNYFEENEDENAITYLALANKLIHQVKPNAITIAEEMSGMPGIAYSVEGGGIGFDFKLQMGIPDYWIKLLKEKTDEQWHVGDLFYELTNKRKEEKTISYAESHDQALVGDKTIFFRLLDKEIYSSMSVFDNSLLVERAIAIHKMIRLITLGTSGDGYLNFMGNEWGHPEWIDFPREGNNWSYHHARRLWSLVDDKNLKFQFLNHFDKAMIQITKDNLLYKHTPKAVVQDIDNQILIFERGSLLFVFNFNGQKSHTDYRFETLPGKYTYLLNTDSTEFDGLKRIDNTVEHFTQVTSKNNHQLSLYIPSRTGLVLKRNE